MVRIESEAGTRYAPLPYEAFLQRIERAFRHLLDSVRQALRNLGPPIGETHIWKTQDHSTLRQHTRRLIDRPEAHFLVIIGSEVDPLGRSK